LTKPYRILHLVHGLDVGGLERVVTRLVLGLDRNRFQARVCCFDERGPLADELAQAGIDVLFLPRRPGVDYRYSFRLAQLFRRQRINLVHLHNDEAFLYGVPAAMLARTTGIVYTEHGRVLPASRRRTFAHRRLARFPVHTVPVSGVLREQLLRFEHFRPRAMTVIPNGVPEPPAPNQDSRQRARAEMGASKETILLGTVGRLAEVKDHLGLIRAMAQLVRTHPQARLAIVGGGPLYEGLHREVARLGLQPFVTLVGERSNVATYLHAFDVFLLSSKSEGMPLALLEALAAGKPVVAMNVGGVGEVLRDGVEGYLVEPGNYADFLTRVRRLIDHPQERDLVGESARDTFLARFHVDRMIASYTNLYEQLLGL
jgi:glycosyltransferase involved in cell wall biosynthesis